MPPHIIPKNLIGKAINYADGQWAHLENYLLDGNLKLDNNAVKNSIRPFAVGRKNWLYLLESMYRLFFIP